MRFTCLCYSKYRNQFETNLNFLQMQNNILKLKMKVELLQTWKNWTVDFQIDIHFGINITSVP